MATINPKKIGFFSFFWNVFTKAQFALLAQKPLPAKAEMFMTVNIATKKVAFDRFENIEAVDVAA